MIVFPSILRCSLFCQNENSPVDLSDFHDNFNLFISSLNYYKTTWSRLWTPENSIWFLRLKLPHGATLYPGLCHLCAFARVFPSPWSTLTLPTSVSAGVPQSRAPTSSAREVSHDACATSWAALICLSCTHVTLPITELRVYLLFHPTPCTIPLAEWDA